MPFYHFPGEFVYWDRVENHDEIKRELLPVILEKDNKIKNNPFEACKFNTSFSISGKTNSENDFLYNENVQHIFINLFVKMLKMYEETCPFKIDVGLYTIRYIWWNVYNKDDYQELHDHISRPLIINNNIYYTSFSAIYILCDENEESSIVFKKTPPVTIGPYFQNFEFNTKNCQDIKEGTILIFPSNLLHLVKPCIKPGRVTIACNIDSTWGEQYY